MTKFIGIIPARYASTRFPGKPLAELGGKPVIEHVYRRVSQVMDEVVVATDDERIAKVVDDFGGCAIMTSATHPSGTDRVREAMELSGTEADVVINIQGDEPFIDPEQIKTLMKAFDDESVDIATLARKFKPESGFEALFDPNVVKVVMDNNGRALYFSRSIIPYVRGVDWQAWVDKTVFYTHVGIYAYRRAVMKEITCLCRSSLETAESLEQLRWLQNGYTINVGITDAPTIGIDTPADLEAARSYLAGREL